MRYEKSIYKVISSDEKVVVYVNTTNPLDAIEQAKLFHGWRLEENQCFKIAERVDE